MSRFRDTRLVSVKQSYVKLLQNLITWLVCTIKYFKRFNVIYNTFIRSIIYYARSLYLLTT